MLVNDNPYILPPIEFMRRFRVLNPTLWDEWENKWVEQDKNKLANYNRWRVSNPDKYKAIQDRYNRKPKAKLLKAIRRDRRRALELNCNGSHTIEDWIAKLELFKGRCAYCGKKKPLVKYHIISLSNKGTNNIGNVIPACRRCNLKKSNRDRVWFRKYGAQLDFVLQDTLSVSH